MNRQKDIWQNPATTGALNTLFRVLEDHGIKYCVMNSYEDLPDKVEGDVDIAVERLGLKNMDQILDSIARENGLKIIQKIHHNYEKYAYILSPVKIFKPFRLQLDFMNDFAVRGYPALISNDFMVKHRRKYKNFFVPDTKSEFIFSILRRIYKGDLDSSRAKRLKELYLKDSLGCRELLLKYFPPKMSDEIIKIILQGDLHLFNIQCKFYKRKLLSYSLRRNFPFVLKYWIFEILRAIERIRHPVGIMVAFLSPDGGGKSTIAKNVMQLAAGSFHGEKLFYCRPELFPQPGELLGFRKPEERMQNANPRPHDHKKERPIKSILRFCYYVVDYILGYYLKVFPLNVKKHLCIFDRYYYDYLVDLFRYNFSIPNWLPELLLPIIPKPDIVIYLHNTPEELYKRKKELPLEELKRQVKAYQDILPKLPNTHQIITDKPIEEVTREAVSLILEKKAEQTLSLLKIN